MEPEHWNGHAGTPNKSGRRSARFTALLVTRSISMHRDGGTPLVFHWLTAIGDTPNALANAACEPQNSTAFSRANNLKLFIDF